MSSKPRTVSDDSARLFFYSEIHQSTSVNSLFPLPRIKLDIAFENKKNIVNARNAAFSIK